MADNWEWDSSDADSGVTPGFRQFKRDDATPAGEKGLWAILDSVARQPARPELRRESAEPTPFPPVAAPAPTPEPSFTQGFLNSMVPPPIPATNPVVPPAPAAQAPAPQVPQTQWAPPPPVAPAPPRAAFNPSPAPTPQPEPTGFGHLFKRQREDSVAPPQGGTPLKALFRRIS